MTAYVARHYRDRSEEDRSRPAAARGRSVERGRHRHARDGVATTTVVTDKNCAAGSTPLLTPVTANAATEVGNGTLYVSAVANGSFTITHANSATTGRTFLYALHG